jgi:hypothetical protein
MFLHFRRRETHARECLQCWTDRDVFDSAYTWWKTGNSEFTPTKLSGPRFSNELCKAYRERLRGSKRKQVKKMDAKKLRELIALYCSGFARVAGEYRRWANQDNREPLVLKAVEQEIAAAEADEDEAVMPMIATADQKPEIPEAANDDAVPEQHPGVAPTEPPGDDDTAAAQAAVTVEGQHPEAHPDGFPTPDVDTAMTIQNRHLTLEQIKQLESANAVPGWRGHGVNSAARQHRAGFLKYWTDTKRTGRAPELLTDRAPDFWAGQAGVAFDDLLGVLPERWDPR